MASFSYSLTAGLVTTDIPSLITTGTSVPGAGDIELRITNTNFASRKDVLMALEAFKHRIEDSNYGSADLGLV